MRGKSVTLCLIVFGLSLAASISSDEDSSEEWVFLPVKEATTTTEPPRTKAKVTSTTTTTTTTTQRAPAGRAAYEYYEDAAGSLKLHPAAPWREARRVCHGEGAELASPETAGLRTAMSTALLSSPQAPEQFYTGINDLYSKGLFSSLRGTPLTEMALRWAAGAPSNLTSRDNCLALRRDGLLRDTSCDAALPYFCYKKKAAGPETECGTNPGETLQQAGFAKWNTEESSESGSCAGLDCAHAVLVRHACALELPFMCEKKPYL